MALYIAVIARLNMYN